MDRKSSVPAGGIKCLPPFLWKTYELLEEPGLEHVVSWNPQGTAFVVSSPEEFSRTLLPRYFKHSNFSSFIRQLNIYGFRKGATERWEFRHEKFQRGKRHLLEEITRRRCEPSIYPSFLKACDEGGGGGRRPTLRVVPTEAGAEEEEDGVGGRRRWYRQQRRRQLLEENRLLREEKSTLLSEVARYKALHANLIKWCSGKCETKVG